MTTSTTERIVSIRETVEQAVTSAGYGSYMRYAGPVVDALTAREAELSDKLVDFAVDSGAEEDEVKAYLREVGMQVKPDPEPEPDDDDEEEGEADDNGRIASALERIERQIGSLTEFARANGYRG